MIPRSSQAWAPHATLGRKSHTKPWFKSTLLLFLRLLLSTKKKKKKDGLPTLFFFFFQEKQATENGMLQIYKHREGQFAHGWLGSGEIPRSCPGRRAHSLADVCGSPLQGTAYSR